MDEGLIFGNREGQQGVILCGQEMILDVLSNYMRLNGIPALRAYVGSFESLLSLYNDKVQVATAHLWDSDSGEYNIPYVRRLLPGIPAVIIHLTSRMQGFYVAKGNPKNIKEWSDLAREDVKIINRESGAGSRVLLDEHLHLLGITGKQIRGYENITSAHLTVGGAVSRGEADVGVGTERNGRQIEGIDFIPMQKEKYDLIVKKDFFDSQAVRTMLKILRSDSFQYEFSCLGYDVEDMGRIIAET